MKPRHGLFLFVAVFVLHLPALAGAQTNEVGIYADPFGGSSELFGPPDVPFNAYVVLTNPSNIPVWGFEFGYTMALNDPSALFRLQNVLPPVAIDVGDNSNLLSGDYVVGLATPLISDVAMVLVTWQFMLTSPQTVFMELGPSRIPSLPYDLPAYEAGGTIVPMTLAPTCWGTRIHVNESCPLPVEEQAFGAVKALYR
ncbi:MAG: hypothetical protein QNL91_02475 [Candidatus Krumholzibacteria bacterium]|nr:hypothetical protein [Candidatus Krumholzibacteria bacterium]